VTSEPVRRWIEASPYTAALGVRVRALASERVVLELPFAESNSNPGKALHGGCAA
jgi:acyl-coenzyme A thioesterase PaaI-like protein